MCIIYICAYVCIHMLKHLLRPVRPLYRKPYRSLELLLSEGVLLLSSAPCSGVPFYGLGVWGFGR